MMHNLHHIILSLSHYCYHVDFFIVGIVEDNSSNRNKYQNCTNPQGTRSAMVGPAGAYLSYGKARLPNLRERVAF